MTVVKKNWANCWGGKGYSDAWWGASFLVVELVLEDLGTNSETQTTRIDKGDQRQNQRVQIAMQLTENTWYTLAIRNMAKHTRNQLVLSLCLLLEGWISVVYAFTSYFKISAQPLF